MLSELDTSRLGRQWQTTDILEKLAADRGGWGIVAIKSGARFRKPGLSDKDRSFTPPVPHGGW